MGKPTVSGSITVASQQQSLLLQNQDATTNPRTAFRRDLLEYIKTQLDKGHEILLVGDFNEPFGMACPRTKEARRTQTTIADDDRRQRSQTRRQHRRLKDESVQSYDTLRVRRLQLQRTEGTIRTIVGRKQQRANEQRHHTNTIVNPTHPLKTVWK